MVVVVEIDEVGERRRRGVHKNRNESVVKDQDLSIIRAVDRNSIAPVVSVRPNCL